MSETLSGRLIGKKPILRRCLPMKLYIFPPSTRVLAIMALKDHFEIECEVQAIDLGKGDQRTPEYVALNPNMKMPLLEDDGFVLWESNAILFHLANKKPQSGLWPREARAQADVVRWLAWQSAHWDAESFGMVSFEKSSKRVLGLGAADPAFVARGEQNFRRFAAVLDESLRGRAWLVGDALTIADFSVAGLVPSAARMGLLPETDFPEIARWYATMAALPAWGRALAAKDASMAAWLEAHAARTI
jgi:glutathione S-transferase